VSDHISFPIEEIFEEGLSRSQIKKLKKGRKVKAPIQDHNHMVLRHIEPKTENQKKAFDLFNSGKNLMLHGVSGTGKTFIATYLAMREISKPDAEQNKLIIVRSAVPSRDMGFMPGTLKEKSAMYEAPYQAHFADLYGRDDAYTLMKNKKSVDFITTSFVRGTTIDNAIVLIDEIQNFDSGECHSVITRLGNNSRLIVCGDYRQNDLAGKKGQESGLRDIYKILTSMKSVGTVDFQIEDCVRSGFLKEYLLTRYKLGFDDIF
jgi:phosphate starvation-inducible protein PhoH